jgi:hypothetical protein
MRDVVLIKEVLPPRPAQDRSVLDCWTHEGALKVKAHVFVVVGVAVAGVVAQQLLGWL